MPYLSQSPTQNWKCLPEGPWCRELLQETYWIGTVTFDYLYWQKDQHYEITNFSKRRGNGKSDGLNEIRTPLQHGIQPASLYIYNYFVIVAETRWNLCLFPFFFREWIRLLIALSSNQRRRIPVLCAEVLGIYADRRVSKGSKNSGLTIQLIWRIGWNCVLLRQSFKSFRGGFSILWSLLVIDYLKYIVLYKDWGALEISS